jgi:hypothetical protein
MKNIFLNPVMGEILGAFYQISPPTGFIFKKQVFFYKDFSPNGLVE